MVSSMFGKAFMVFCIIFLFMFSMLFFSKNLLGSSVTFRLGLIFWGSRDRDLGCCYC